MTTAIASADPLRDEIAPAGKLRVAIAISPAGGAFWSTKKSDGSYAGIPVDLGKAMAAKLGLPVNTSRTRTPDRSPTRPQAENGTSRFCRRIRSG